MFGLNIFKRKPDIDYWNRDDDKTIALRAKESLFMKEKYIRDNFTPPWSIVEPETNKAISDMERFRKEKSKAIPSMLAVVKKYNLHSLEKKKQLFKKAQEHNQLLSILDFSSLNESQHEIFLRVITELELIKTENSH